MIFVYKRFNQKDAQQNYDGIRKWFEQNPRRKVCRTDVGEIRRSRIKEDLLEHCCKNVKLKD